MIQTINTAAVVAVDGTTDLTAVIDGNVGRRGVILTNCSDVAITIFLRTTMSVTTGAQLVALYAATDDYKGIVLQANSAPFTLEYDGPIAALAASASSKNLAVVEY